MQLSTKGQYALYAMHDLAVHEHDGVRNLKAMQGIGVPMEYLEQLLGQLRRAGLVKTVRGANGGYMLAKPTEEITLGDIIRATEGPITFTKCVEDADNCQGAFNCPARPVWVYLTEQIDMLLNTITLRDVLDERKFAQPERKA
ncbi:MAG: RrF2 family transcriptional regulator [Clostridia bacterium]|nr:RrF2 family transcriptional regulator [Clostridia bacterium]MBR1685885.1 RrF2 family transcriptional regulator [Clostridia bacterium]MBR2288011.1 RrF2 family transcriptional regulator [Clostridia bacterium]